MHTTQKTEKISCLRLPLAVYREVAAHLRQIGGVSVELLPASAEAFDYLQSQVGGLLVSYPIAPGETTAPRLEAILAYYSLRHGVWQREPC